MMIKELVRKTSVFKLYKKFRKRKMQKRIDGALLVMQKNSYSDVEFLGFGKDGITYRATSKMGDKVVVKVLSQYAKVFLPITNDVMKITGGMKEFYKFEILNDELLQYEFEPLEHMRDFTIKQFAKNFSAVCDLQMVLLTKDMVVWDFGFSDPNYMLTSDNNIKWVDYGGNAFLYLKKEMAPISPPRPNLVYAQNDFLVLSVLLHWVRWVFVNKEATILMTKVQDATVSYDEAFVVVSGYLKGTALEFLLSLRDEDLLSEKGWHALQEKLRDYVQSDEKEILE